LTGGLGGLVTRDRRQIADVSFWGGSSPHRLGALAGVSSVCVTFKFAGGDFLGGMVTVLVVATNWRKASGRWPFCFFARVGHAQGVVDRADSPSDEIRASVARFHHDQGFPLAGRPTKQIAPLAESSARPVGHGPAGRRWARRGGETFSRLGIRNHPPPCFFIPRDHIILGLCSRRAEEFGFAGPGPAGHRPLGGFSESDQSGLIATSPGWRLRRKKTRTRIGWRSS